MAASIRQQIEKSNAPSLCRDRKKQFKNNRERHVKAARALTSVSPKGGRSRSMSMRDSKKIIVMITGIFDRLCLRLRHTCVPVRTLPRYTHAAVFICLFENQRLNRKETRMQKITLECIKLYKHRLWHKTRACP